MCVFHIQERDVSEALVRGGRNQWLYNARCGDALLVFGANHPGKALMIHNGDSLLYRFDLNQESAHQISETNHCFVGKVRSIYQRQLIGFSQDSRFMLATDGFLDIIREIRKLKRADPFQSITEIWKTAPVDHVVSQMLERYDTDPSMRDDLAVIALDPNAASQV